MGCAYAYSLLGTIAAKHAQYVPAAEMFVSMYHVFGESGDVVLTGGAKCNVSKMGSGNVRCS